MKEMDNVYQEIGKELDLTNPEDLPKYIIYKFIQQKEIWETTRIKRIELQNQSTRRYTRGLKCQSLYNYSQRRQSVKLIVRWTT